MKKLALDIICKNESHIIRRMLDSVASITDLIVAVDTGSTDKTIAIIHAFGKTHNIPTYVFERPFDNFCNSRNYALLKLKEMVQHLNWDQNSTWGFWIDCDEVMHVEKEFNKESISLDYYYVPSYEKGARYLKSLFFRISLDWTWISPIHEHLVCKEQKPSSSVIEAIRIQYEKKGASWKGDQETKFLNYVVLLQKYIEEKDRSFRWLADMGDSYYSAADVCKSKPRKRTLLLESLNYYSKAATISTDTRNEKCSLYIKIAKIRLSLAQDWDKTREVLLKAYQADKRLAEPFFYILNHYIKTHQWQIAYLYSSFAVANYHGQVPKADDISTHVKESIYHWRLLFYNSIISIKCGKSNEGKLSYSNLLDIVKEQPGYFKQTDLAFIRLNSPEIIEGIPGIHSLILKQYFG